MRERDLERLASKQRLSLLFTKFCIPFNSQCILVFAGASLNVFEKMPNRSEDLKVKTVAILRCWLKAVEAARKSLIDILKLFWTLQLDCTESSPELLPSKLTDLTCQMRSRLSSVTLPEMRWFAECKAFKICEKKPFKALSAQKSIKIAFWSNYAVHHNVRGITSAIFAQTMPIDVKSEHPIE